MKSIRTRSGLPAGRYRSNVTHSPVAFHREYPPYSHRDAMNER
jgi:hypothetical protein